MKYLSIPITILVLCVFSAYAANVIPEDEVDEEKILFGVANSFTKAAEVDYTAVVKATPEYAEIKSEKIQSGTARYFILISDAGDRAIRVISEVAETEGYDLVTKKGYLSSLTTPLKAANITKNVLKLMKEES